ITSDDASQPSITVTLLGERRRQALATPAQLDFGQVDVGSSSDKTLLLENRTTLPMRIDQLVIPPPFKIVSPAPPIILQPGQQVTVTVRFTPADSLDANATLVAHHDQPCTDSTLIPVTGRGHILHVGAVVAAVPD